MFLVYLVYLKYQDAIFVIFRELCKEIGRFIILTAYQHNI